MKTTKKLLAMALALCMVFSFAATAFAAALPFVDVKETDWSYGNICYVYENGLMQGTGSTTFGPKGTSTRAMMVTILHRLENTPAASVDAGFTDLTGDWYVAAVNWGFESGVVMGVSDTKFNPNGEITREQMVTMLYRYAQYKGYNIYTKADLSSYPDVDKVNGWAQDAMSWAVGMGLIYGDEQKDGTYLNPGNKAERQQMAAILQRFIENVGPSSEESPFLLLDTEVQVVVPAGQTVYFGGYFNGMDLTASGEDFTLTTNGESVESANGVASARLVSANPRMPAVFAITNNGEAAATYSLSVTYPVGTQGNPEPLMSVAVINVDIAEGSDQGYYYTWTSHANGTLVLSAEDYDATKYDVMLSSTGSYAMPLMSESGDGTVSMEVKSGDTVTIQVAAMPDDKFNYPALQTVLTGDFISVAGSMENPAALVIGENAVTVEAADADGYFLTWTAAEDGQLSVTMPSDMGWFYVINNETANVYGDSQTSDMDPVVNPGVVNVSKDDVIMINMNTYDPANPWSSPAGTIHFTATFTAGSAGGDDSGKDDGGDEPKPQQEEYVVNYDVQLALGENKLTMDPAAVTTVFEFTPEESGVYTFTASDANAKVGYWGGTPHYVTDQTENKTNTLTHSLPNAGPSIMVGISGVEACTLTVARTGEAEQKPTVETVVYENKVTPEKYTLDEDASLVYVNVTDDKADAAVLGEDGFYHLNTADGPMLLVDLNNTTISLIDAMGYGQVKATIYDDNATKVIDYYEALSEYTNCMDPDKNVYPLTVDLMEIFQNLGASKGWYSTDVLGGFYLFGDETVDPATAWMFACCYAE